ncbi:MAG: right-handed parallel beta-helix repeat-containing protein, partial [Bacteroidales bacterium]
MKKTLFFAILALSINAIAQTNVPGGNVSGTWTIAGSPYLIQGSIQILNDSTLTIEPGVTVNFQGTYKMYVQGRVIAIGTAKDTIIFTSANPTNGWRGIRFDNTPATNDTSKLIYCKVQYGRATGTGNDARGGALYFENFSKAIISNCLITNNSSNAFGGGICCSDYSSPTISNNIISNNTASDNSIWGNGGGICCYFSSPTISNNNISNNTAFSAFNGGGGG